MNILIYDDDKGYQRLVERKINECHKDKDVDLKVYKYSTIGELLTSFNERSYQFAYVEMTANNQKGVEIAKLIHKMNPVCRIIFMSNEYRQIPEAFEVNAFEYFLKPIVTKEFNEIFNHMMKWYNQQNIKFVIPVREIAKKRVFSVDEIKYIQTNYNDLEIVTVDGQHYMTHVKNRYKLREALKPRWFMQVNASVLVNMKYLDFLTDRNVILTTREVFHISRLTYLENHMKYEKFLNKENDEDEESKGD